MLVEDCYIEAVNGNTSVRFAKPAQDSYTELQ